jgi:putative ABC transport system permease protein
VSGLAGLALRSAWNRRFVLGLVVASIALSTFLLLAIERIRADVREGFAQSVSGTDLIVGPRTGSVQLLLYAVFRIGGATNTIRMESVQAVAAHRAVAWVVPIALGDTHRGFPVVGTTAAYFERFRHGDRQPLAFAQGRRFEGLWDVVLGAEVAERLGYGLGDRLTLSHGDGAFAANEHADKPFAVVGVLARTGTPVDRSLHVSLEAMQAIHLDWQAGVPLPGRRVGAEEAAAADLAPRTVNAALVGLVNRAAVFAVQRDVAAYRPEALMAVLPGVALDELWTIVGAGEKALLAVSALVALVSLAGLMAVVLAGLEPRRRELAILRAVGAGPRHVLALLLLEGLLVGVAGIAIGAVAVRLAVLAFGDAVAARAGLVLGTPGVGSGEAWLLAGLLGGALLASLVPGYRAYRLSLADGLAPKA